MFATMESSRLRMLQLTSLSGRACGWENVLVRLPRSPVFFSAFIANGEFVGSALFFSLDKSASGFKHLFIREGELIAF